MTDKIKVLGLSDPPNTPSGFGRVSRELFTRLHAQHGDRFELGFLSRGWVGSNKYGVQPYSASNNDELCSGAFPIAAIDFGLPFILWTLVDPWQTGWLHIPKNTYAMPGTTAWIEANREKFRWVGHYPIDGEGVDGGPPFWYDTFLNGPDVTVFISEFGKRVMGDRVKTKTRIITHAVDTSVFFPVSPPDKEAMKEKAHLGGRHVVISVMANRRRKFWPELLLAFRTALRKNPDLHLLAVVGDVHGEADDSWSLADVARALGLLEKGKERVSFVSAVPDKVLARLYQMSDQSVLLSAGEGFGIPQLEAHACGLPCAVGRYSASEELAVDASELVEPRAWTFAGNNVIKRPVYAWPDVADKILGFAMSDARRLGVGAKGYQQGLDRSWDKVLPVWVALFEEVWAELTAEKQEPPTPDSVKEDAVVA